MNWWYDQPSQSLVYDDPAAIEALPYTEGGTNTVNGYAVVPVNLYNLQVLAACKLPVMPIVTDETYDWPIKNNWRPREHQKLMTNFMVLNPKSFNLSDMGTMKTLSALWAADFIMQQYPAGECRAIVAAPLSILQRVWGDAIFQNFLGKRTYVIVHGDAAKRQKLLAQPADFYIINHDGLKVGASIKKGKIELTGLAKQINERADIKLAIIDEASAYRDHTTKRHRITRKVLEYIDYQWWMTGTPTPNGPLDAYGLSVLVNGAYGESFTSYERRIMYQVSQFTWVPRAGANDEAHRLLQPSIRFEMRECTDVPPCTEQMRDVELSAEQQRLYKELKRDLQLQMEKGTITAVNEAALRLKLIQISCGAIYDHDHRVTRIDCTPRLNELRAVIEEAHRKVIIFTPLTSIVHLLYDELTEYSRAMVNGEVPMKARDEIFRMFQQEASPQLLIADPGAISHGLDLYEADTVVWYGATDRTELYLQGNRRIDRPGQRTHTTIVQLAGTPVEREIFRRTASNTSQQGAILEMVRGQ